MDIVGILIFFIVITIVSNFIEKIKGNESPEENVDNKDKFEIPSIKPKKPPVRLKETKVKALEDKGEIYLKDDFSDNMIEKNSKEEHRNSGKNDVINGIIFSQILQPPKAYQNLKNNRK